MLNKLYRHINVSMSVFNLFLSLPLTYTCHNCPSFILALDHAYAFRVVFPMRLSLSFFSLLAESLWTSSYCLCKLGLPSESNYYHLRLTFSLLNCIITVFILWYRQCYGCWLVLMLPWVLLMYFPFSFLKYMNGSHFFRSCLSSSMGGVLACFCIDLCLCLIGL